MTLHSFIHSFIHVIHWPGDVHLSVSRVGEPGRAVRRVPGFPPPQLAGSLGLPLALFLAGHCHLEAPGPQDSCPLQVPCSPSHRLWAQLPRPSLTAHALPGRAACFLEASEDRHREEDPLQFPCGKIFVWIKEALGACFLKCGP